MRPSSPAVIPLFPLGSDDPLGTRSIVCTSSLDGGKAHYWGPKAWRRSQRCWPAPRPKGQDGARCTYSFCRTAINLVDLRPGRAGKAFVLLGIVLTAFRPEARWIAPLAAAVVGYLPWDLRGEVMMGDTGANPLGAVLGFACWSSLTGPPRIAVIAALLALNAAAERISFSQFIACHPFLDWLDKLGRDEGK